MADRAGAPIGTQVLVIGSGIAGLTAALRASRTAEVLLPQVSGMIAEAPQSRESHENARPVRLLRPVRRAG